MISKVIEAPKNNYTFAPELNFNLQGYFKTAFVSPYFTIGATWYVIPFVFKPLVYEVKVPVIGQGKNGVCQRLYISNDPITTKVGIDVGMYQCKFQLINGLTKGKWLSCAMKQYGNSSNSKLSSWFTSKWDYSKYNFDIIPKFCSSPKPKTPDTPPSTDTSSSTTPEVTNSTISIDTNSTDNANSTVSVNATVEADATATAAALLFDIRNDRWW